MAKPDYDLNMFRDTRGHATELETSAGQRNELFRRMEWLYWMRWNDEEKVRNKIDNVKLTKSPRARNSIKGAERLLTATDPQITVPFNINDAMAKQASSKMEKFAHAMWFASGRIQQRPTHYDIVKSALVYSAVNIAITSTKDLVKNAPDVPAIKARYERTAERTPYLFEVWNPKSCYPEFDSHGLRSFYRKIKTTQADMMHTPFAKGFEDQMRTIKPEYSHYENVMLHDFYDLQYRTVWVDGADFPLYQEEHGLPFIPVVSQLIEGSRLFEDASDYRDGRRLLEERYEPFLMTLDKSGLAERQNLLLTVLYTITFAIGANPMFVEYVINPDEEPPVDETYPGKTLRMRTGERREPMVKQVIDPSMIESWNTAVQLEEESTIPRQTLGEPLSGSNTYSTTALLHQAGRLPLLMSQRMSGWAIGSAIEYAFRWMKHDKYTGQAMYQESDVSMSHDEIPKRFEIKATLEISLPQDDLTNANVARIASEGDQPLVSQRYARENLLKVGQSEDMQEEIWTEQSGNIKFRKYMMQQLAQLAQMEQMAMQPTPEAAGMPGPQPPGMPPGPPPPGMPTEPEQLGPEPGPAPMVEPNPLGNMPGPQPPVPPVPPMLPNQEPLP
jgi:hypothetical protein